MMVRTVENGQLQENCYIVGCEATRQAVIIDPGSEADRIIDAIIRDHLLPIAILATHAHVDHVGAVQPLKVHFQIPFLLHNDDRSSLSALPAQARMLRMPLEGPPTPDDLVEDGREVQFGELTGTILHTPGHTRGGICFHVAGSLFSGDTLFQGSVGRTDLTGGSWQELETSIRQKLLILPDETVVYPGHGPKTTIGEERLNNPFLRA